MSRGYDPEIKTGSRIPTVFPAKLRVPHPVACLKRERLFRHLDAVDGPLVVVHAGAGYGKTTLIASYLRERERQAIWYHFGATDRIQGTMVAHLCHAIAERFPAVTASGPEILQMPEDPELAGAALARLLDRADAPLTLVLEEYNRVEEDSEIHRVVLALVEHLPSHVRLFLLSRGRPPLSLSWLAMGGRVKVLTRDDLAFTLEETAALFASVYDHRLNSEELTLVMRRLEGWVAGLLLTHEALKVTTPADRARFWARFTESPQLFDYLAREVLAALPPTTLRFLYQTSIFSVLDAELIEEFLPGCGAVSVLGGLVRANLFTITLDGAGTHYRYHNLLRQYLHRKLLETEGEEPVRKLHARAAELYSRRDEIDYAIGHSLAAREFHRVRGLLQELANRHRADVILRLMEGWLERAFPALEGLSGLALRRILPFSTYDLILPGLQRLAEAPSDSIDHIAQAHAQQRLGAYLFFRGRLDEGITWLANSRDTFRDAGHLTSACISSTLLGLAYLHKGKPEAASGPVADALEWGGNERGFASVNVLWHKAELALAFGRFREAEEASRASLERDASFQFGSAPGFSTLALALLHQGRVQEAREACDEAMAQSRRVGVPADIGLACTRLAVVLRAVGDLKGAQAAANEAVAVLEGHDSFLARALLVRAEVATAEGDPDASKLWAEVQEFWASRGYQMDPLYDGLVAPLLLGRAFAPVSALAVPGQLDAEPPGAPMVIRTLGVFLLQIQGQVCDPRRWGRAPSLRLFFYLLLHRGRLVPRDELLEVLWPDTDPAISANRLAAAVYVLRREIGNLSCVVERQGQLYCLRLPPEANLDLDRYLALAEDGLVRGDRSSLEAAAALYRGDFLMEYPYDEFLETERTRLRELQRRVLMAIAEACRSKADPDAALAWYRQAQRLDPLLEEPVRRIMEIMLERNEPGSAAYAYQRLSEGMHRELGLAPSDELRGLYHHSLAKSSHQNSSAAAT